MDTLINREIKGYEIRERVGAGGFGAVYRATQPSVGREVAIKVILPHFANQPDFVRRFEVEAQVIARLEHPHIVPLYDYWRDPEGAYLVMRWLRGSLRATIERNSWTLEATARLLEQLAAALAVAHREGIVHRDIKPDNILLDEDENAYLADFGIAKDVHLRSTTPGKDDEVAGSPAYLSPEQIRSDEVTARTDLYSLGYVLYELLTGEKPFLDAKTPSDYIMKHLSEPMPMLSIQHTHIPAAVDEVLQTVTAKDPSQRYANALRFAAAFRAALPNRLPRIPSQPLADPLTERELEVLRLMIEGLDNQEIAQRLFLTPGTVKWYIKQVYSKLDAHSRQQAIDRAISLKLTEPRQMLTTDHPPLPDTPTMQGSERIIQIIDPENPYKGLRAFQESDADDFFGRAVLTEQLLSRLSEGGDSARFLTIVGPSGSGKSSVVRAGLIPALRKGGLAASPHPFIVDFLPGTHPLEELEAALLRVAVNPMPGLLEQLRTDRRGLVRAARRLLPNDNETELILVIDQFEEVFTLVNDEAMRVHFINNLLSAASDPRGRVRILLTLRADFYDRPLMYPRLAEIVRTNTEVIIPLTAREMEQAIIAPLERVGLSAENGLVTTILHDIGEQPGTLPLLQYTLTELFERREGLTLTLDAYKSTGGVLGALARRAEDIYLSLDAETQALARQLFLRMVTLGEGTEDTRRRVLMAEFTALGDETAVEDVVNAFTEYRLLTLDRDPLTHGPTVEISHEALIREWSRLREWLYESREEIRLQRQLTTLAGEWQNAAHESSFLLHGTRLEIFEKWAGETQLALTEQERAYLAASVDERERLTQIEHEQQERELRLAKEATMSAQQAATHQRRSANRLRYLVAVLVIGVLASLLSLSFAVSRGNEAVDARSTSVVVASEAQELALVNGAQAALANGNGDLARSLAVVANRAANPSGQAQVILGEAAYAPGTVHLYRDPSGGSWGVVFSPDGRTAVTANGLIIFWDLTTGEELRHITAPEGTMAFNREFLVFSPDGSFIVISTDYNIDFIDVDTGEVIRTLSGHTDVVRDIRFSPDGQTLISGSFDNTLMIWDVATGAVLRTLTGHEDDVQSVAFSPDGARIISTSDDMTIILWDGLTGEIIHRFNEDHSVYLNPTKGVMFSPDGRTIAASSETSLTLWDAQTFELIWQVELGLTMQLTFSHDGRRLLLGNNNLVQLFDTADGRLVMTLQGHTALVTGVDISPDDRYALTSAFDGTIRLWDLHYGAETVPPMELVGAGEHVAFSPDGAYMLVSSWSDGSGLLTLYDAASGAEIRRFGSDGVAFRNVFNGWRFMPVAFSPDGRNVISSAMTIEEEEVTTQDETEAETTLVSLVMWDVATGTIIREYGPIPINPGRDGNEEVSALQFSPDGSSFIAVSRDETVTVWDVESGVLLRSFGHYDGSYSAVFSPDGRTVLMGETMNAIGLWDFEGGAFIRRFGAFRAPHSARIRTVTFSLDGRYFSSGDDNSLIVLWDVESGQLLQRFVGHQGGIWSLAFNANATLLLSGSVDGAIILWDVATGEAIRRYTGHTGNVRDVRFIDDHSFISLSEDGTLRRWRIDSPSELLAWTYTNRYVPELTCTERELYRLETGCVDDIYPTRTPYVMPTLLPTIVEPSFNLTPTPTVTPQPLLVAHLGENRGEVAADGVQRWLFHGIAGESFTITVRADHVTTTDFQFQDAEGNPLLSPALAIYDTSGVLLWLVYPDENSDAVTENFEVPVTGDYWLEVMDDYSSGSGGTYTLTIEHPPASENGEASAEVTAEP